MVLGATNRDTGEKSAPKLSSISWIDQTGSETAAAAAVIVELEFEPKPYLRFEP